MSRKIRYKAPVAGERPAVRIEFKGQYQVEYFSLRRIAREDFQVTQTELARKIICEWLRRYREAAKNKEERAVRQMALAIQGAGAKLNNREKSQEGAGK